MYKKILLTSVLMLPVTIAYAEPSFNLSDIKKELKQYHNDGEYDKDLSAALKTAKVYLDQRLQNSKDPKHLAIVYDIDETSLSNYPDMVKEGFSDNFKLIIKDQKKADDPAIPETLALFNYAKAHGVTEFFITGRTEDLRAVTVKNLELAGYDGWQALYLKPLTLKVVSAASYKAPIRKQIEAKGYDVILTIGDQQSDLAGGYADKSIKLPNPFYYIA